MSDTIIKVEGLGKSYFIGHERQQGYVALRDILTQKTKGFLRGIGQAFFNKSQISGQEIEEFWALKDVSFEIKAGEAVGIIGNNGAGKSTLLKILSRITEPTKGKITLNGRVASLLEVGTGFHPELSGRENIYLNGSILGMSRLEIKKKFDEIVDFSGVEKFLDTPVKRYSSGMYVRLAFAVAAHLEPEILIVDEVLAVGDAQFQKKCLNKMNSISEKEGRTVLFVSHNINAIQNLCTKGILLSNGKLHHFGEINKTVNTYINNGLSSKYFWEGDYGNEHIAISKVQIFSDEEFNTSIFSNHNNIYFEMYIKIKVNLNDLVAGFIINNSQGEAILASYYNDFSDVRQISKGFYCFKFKIPKYFLAVGSYTIIQNLGIPFQYNIATNESAIEFSVISSSEYGNAYMVDGNRSFNSIIRTKLFEEIRTLE
jgi:lipopolysaccharide transport system ATP-binding protein